MDFLLLSLGKWLDTAMYMYAGLIIEIWNKFNP